MGKPSPKMGSENIFVVWINLIFFEKIGPFMAPLKFIIELNFIQYFKDSFQIKFQCFINFENF